MLGLVVLLAVVAAVLYNFGTMERPSRQVEAEYERLVATGQAVRVQSTGPRIGIPGCRCHSDDPVQQMRHRVYSIKECGGCHGG